MALTEVYTGKNAQLSLATADTPEGADAKAALDGYALQTVGRLTEVRVTVDTALKEFYEVGRRHPVSLSPGDIAIHGSAQRAYINGALLFLLMGRGASFTAVAEPYVQPTFEISMGFADPARPEEALSLTIGGVKFENWRVTVPEDEFVIENLCFRALTIGVLDVGADNAGNVVFADQQ
ncbi:hypothetical protein [Nocardioides soli]|uniref:Uncharacterized protein n=1 Tax=Nocardioides soli TaxID=1036020 RepID=A0A7W4Z2Z6_9ACTN|nr:hypothetical protein [Nocardioides soli]MBB3044538.1 hypothetical protein [Nocardioides soli]